MPISILVCPKCQAQLNLGAVPPGAKVKCGVCGASMTVGTPPSPPLQAVQARPAVAVPPPLPQTVRASAVPVDARPPVVLARRQRRPRRPEKTGLPGVAVAALCGGGVVLLTLVVLAVVLVMNRDSDTPALAAPSERPNVAVNPVQPVAVVQPAPVPARQPEAAPPAAPAPVVAPAPAPLPAEMGDNLALPTLVALKRATVFIKVVAGDMYSTGSGFVARIEGNTAFVVTNHHVIAPPPARIMYLPRPGMPPLPLPPRPGMVRFPQQPSYTLVFNSGTPEERSYKADLAADDAKTDLAVLRIPMPQGVAPITIDPRIGLLETMPVFILGFPFGEDLATGKGGPAITVGKGSVSSIRKNDRGEVSVVQLHGDLNPGNSGGPVVDARGRLVGIAVATVRGTQIGLAIPVAKLPTLLASAPVQGTVVARAPPPPPLTNPPPADPENQPFRDDPPARPAKPPTPLAKGATNEPLSEQDLTQILQVLNGNNPFYEVNPALERLIAAKPQDAQRARVLKALEPLVNVKAGVDTNAVKAMGVWGNRETVTFLLKLVGTDNLFVRHECIQSLGRLRDERAARPLVERLLVLQDKMVASQSLKAMGPAAEKAVLPLLNHGDLFVRREACVILEVIGTKHSLNPLRQAVRDDNGLVRMAAENALAAVQGRKQ